MRWLLLDEVLTIERGIIARTRSRVPSAIYAPELLMAEMMAQTAGLLLGAESDFRDDLIFAKIENASFCHPFQTGDEVEITAASESLKLEGAWFDAQIRMKGRVFATSRFMLMNVGRLIQDAERSITFHDAFMNHFSVRDKVKQTGSCIF